MVLMNFGDFASSPSATRSSDIAWASALSVTLGGPQRIEQFFFCDERACVIDEMQQQVQQLWRQIDRFSASQDTVTDAVDEERPEAVRCVCHRRRILPSEGC